MLPFLFLPVPGSLSTKEKGSGGRKACSLEHGPTKGSVSLNQLHPEARFTIGLALLLLK